MATTTAPPLPRSDNGFVVITVILIQLCLMTGSAAAAACPISCAPLESPNAFCESPPLGGKCRYESFGLSAGAHCECETSVGKVSGLVFGILAAIMLCVLISWFVRFRNYKRRTPEELYQKQMATVGNSMPLHVYSPATDFNGICMVPAHHTDAAGHHDANGGGLYAGPHNANGEFNGMFGEHNDHCDDGGDGGE